jgi:ATP-dependent DNA helicase RecG
MALSLATEVKYIPGVGPRLGELLAAHGVFTVEDLLYHLPFRYEDRSQLRPIQALLSGESGTVVAQVQTVKMTRTRRGMAMLAMTVGDGGGTLQCVWYNADYLKDKFESGQTVALFGKLEREYGRLQMRQPEFEILGEPEEGADEKAGVAHSLKLGRIVPVYEAMGALTSGRLRRLVYRALQDLPGEFPDALPAELRARFKLPERRAALIAVHFPENQTPIEELQEARTPAQIRLILEELFYLQAGLELKRRRVRRQAGPAMISKPAIRESLKRLLPFHPTQDQKSVLREIVLDMQSGRPMRRLLQGDVGSGKTIVALQAAVFAMENNYQVALMAPTQILAEQHYLYAKQRLAGYRVELVLGGAAKRKRATPLLPEPPQLVIGTQALLEGGFQFSRLGLVIVDEQHRFGVLQRFQLMHKGADPATHPAHVLVMTATPIPRTLALALYGDLDTSVIRQSPPGALDIVTRVLPGSRSDDVYEFVRRRCASGRQAYFVYPLVEESEALDLKPAQSMFEKLRTLYPYQVGLLHGKLTPVKKNATMAAFRAGKIQVLVATTVIEVGMDVPNATTMVIEHAERFGIAQLHQLRGRVGRPQPPGMRRASEQSCCILLHGPECGELAQRRLAAVAATRDGFELAEADLKLRGPGEFFGTQQSGAPMFTVAQPLRDQAWMEIARSEARAYLDRAGAAEVRVLVEQIQQRWQRRYGLVEVG